MHFTPAYVQKAYEVLLMFLARTSRNILRLSVYQLFTMTYTGVFKNFSRFIRLAYFIFYNILHRHIETHFEKQNIILRVD